MSGYYTPASATRMRKLSIMKARLRNEESEVLSAARLAEKLANVRHCQWR